MEASRGLWRELIGLSLLESLVTLAGGVSLIGFASTSVRPDWAPGWIGAVLVALGTLVALLGAAGLVLWIMGRTRRAHMDRRALDALAAEGVERLALDSQLGPGVDDADSRSEGMRIWLEGWEAKVEQALGGASEAVHVFVRPVDTAQMDYRRAPVHRLRVKLFRLGDAVPGLPMLGAELAGNQEGRAPGRPRFLTPVTPAFESEIDARSRVGMELMQLGAYPAAFETYRLLLERMLQEQTTGRRLHKGLPLHNMGLARMRSGLIRDGIRWTLMAFIEDALSRAEESDVVSVELYRPAAENLRLYGLSHADLMDLARRIRRRVESGELVQEPSRILLEEHLDATVDGLVRALKGAQTPGVEPVEFPPVRVRVSLPFVAADLSFALPPAEAATLVTSSLVALAAAGAVGVFWVTGVVDESWELAVGILSGGTALGALTGLIVRIGGRTAVGRLLLAAVRFISAHILVPLLVAIVGGVLVAYVTGAWRLP